MKRFSPLSAIVILLLLGGCILVAVAAGVLIGAGTYLWSTNEFTQDFGVAFERVWDSARRAVKELQIHEINATKDALKGTLDARRADDTAVTITVEWKSETVTKVTIRVGTFSSDTHHQAALTIRDKMVEILGKK